MFDKKILRFKTKVLTASLALVWGLTAGATPSFAAPDSCTVVSTLPNNILYKPANVHGGRGPSFLLGCQVRNLWPAGATLRIRGENGSTLRYSFRMWDVGHHPYGRRYYTGVGTTSNQLRQQALAAGGSAIYVQGKGNICYKIDNPNNRQGNLTPISGFGPC